MLTAIKVLLNDHVRKFFYNARGEILFMPIVKGSRLMNKAGNKFEIPILVLKELEFLPSYGADFYQPFCIIVSPVAACTQTQS